MCGASSAGSSSPANRRAAASPASPCHERRAFGVAVRWLGQALRRQRCARRRACRAASAGVANSARSSGAEAAFRRCTRSRAAFQSASHRRRSGALTPRAGGDFARGALQRGLDAGEAAVEIQRAEGSDLQRARRCGELSGRQAEPCQRMLEQSHQLGGLEMAGGRIGDEIEESAGHGLGERAAGEVIDADAPALQPHGDAAREQTIGRHQRGGAAGRLQRLAQDERDRLRFLLLDRTPRSARHRRARPRAPSCRWSRQSRASGPWTMRAAGPRRR